MTNGRFENDITYDFDRREQFNNIQIFEFYLTSFRAFASRGSVFREKELLSKKRTAQNGR